MKIIGVTEKGYIVDMGTHELARLTTGEHKSAAEDPRKFFADYASRGWELNIHSLFDNLKRLDQGVEQVAALRRAFGGVLREFGRTCTCPTDKQRRDETNGNCITCGKVIL